MGECRDAATARRIGRGECSPYDDLAPLGRRTRRRELSLAWAGGDTRPTRCEEARRRLQVRCGPPVVGGPFDRLGGSHPRRAGALWARLDLEFDAFTADEAVEVDRGVEAAAMEEVFLRIFGADEAEAAFGDDLLDGTGGHVDLQTLPEPGGQNARSVREGGSTTRSIATAASDKHSTNVRARVRTSRYSVGRFRVPVAQWTEQASPLRRLPPRRSRAPVRKRRVSAAE
jgi:hypothetical protein